MGSEDERWLEQRVGEPFEQLLAQLGLDPPALAPFDELEIHDRDALSASFVKLLEGGAAFRNVFFGHLALQHEREQRVLVPRTVCAVHTQIQSLHERTGSELGQLLLRERAAVPLENLSLRQSSSRMQRPERQRAHDACKHDHRQRRVEGKEELGGLSRGHHVSKPSGRHRSYHEVQTVIPALAHVKELDPEDSAAQQHRQERPVGHPLRPIALPAVVANPLAHYGAHEPAQQADSGHGDHRGESARDRPCRRQVAKPDGRKRRRGEVKRVDD